MLFGIIEYELDIDIFRSSDTPNLIGRRELNLIS